MQQKSRILYFSTTERLGGRSAVPRRSKDAHITAMPHPRYLALWVRSQVIAKLQGSREWIHNAVAVPQVAWRERRVEFRGPRGSTPTRGFAIWRPLARALKKEFSIRLSRLQCAQGGSLRSRRAPRRTRPYQPNINNNQAQRWNMYKESLSRSLCRAPSWSPFMTCRAERREFHFRKLCCCVHYRTHFSPAPKTRHLSHVRGTFYHYVCPGRSCRYILTTVYGRMCRIQAVQRCHYFVTGAALQSLGVARSGYWHNKTLAISQNKVCIGITLQYPAQLNDQVLSRVSTDYGDQISFHGPERNISFFTGDNSSKLFQASRTSFQPQ